MSSTMFSTGTALRISQRTCIVFFPPSLLWGTSTTESVPLLGTLGFCSIAAVDKKSTLMTLSSGIKKLQMKRYLLHFRFGILVENYRLSFSLHLLCNICPHVLEEYVGSSIIFDRAVLLCYSRTSWGCGTESGQETKNSKGWSYHLGLFRYGYILPKNTNLRECMQLSEGHFIMCISTWPLASLQGMLIWNTL